MSAPHTGRLRGEINGIACTFDGERWECIDGRLVSALNSATATAPKQHYTIAELAEHVVAKLRPSPSFRIIEWTADDWPADQADLPPGAID